MSDHLQFPIAFEIAGGDEERIRAFQPSALVTDKYGVDWWLHTE